MNDQDWRRIAALLRRWWPGAFDDDDAEAYRVALDRYESADVAKVLGKALESGERFRPSASELVGALAGRTPRPSADEAWRLIEEAVRRVGRSMYAADFDDRHQAAIDWLAGQDVVLGAFAARRGLCQLPGSLGMERVNDPDVGGAVRGRIGKDWRTAVAAAADREARGLPAVDLRDLRLTRHAEQGMAGVVEGLRPSSRLEPGA